MGRKKGSVFHLLWRLLWDSGGAMGAELCDVTACRAQPLTNGLWQGQLTKARARAWILRTLAFFFFFPFHFQEGCCQTAVWCKADWYITRSPWGAEGDEHRSQPTLRPCLPSSTPHTRGLAALPEPSASLRCWWAISHLRGGCQESYMCCISKQALPDFPVVLEGKFSVKLI